MLATGEFATLQGMLSSILRIFQDVRWLMALTAVAALSACAGGNPGALSEDSLAVDSVEGQGILGGTEVTAEDELLDFIVAIEAEGFAGRSIHCTGTLIHPRVILTAAHCTEDNEDYLHSVQVRFRSLKFGADVTAEGARDLTSPRVTRFAERVVRPARWNELLRDDPANRERLRYDVALLVLTRPAPPSTRPVPFQAYDGGFVGLPRITTAGYGATGGHFEMIQGQRVLFSEGDGTLRQVEITRSPREESPVHFDTYQWSKGICHGDSGAPALTRILGHWVQIGVASYVTNLGTSACRKKGYFLSLAGTLTNEDSLANWISAQLAALEQER